MYFKATMEPVPKARARIVRGSSCKYCPHNKVHSYIPYNTTKAEAFIRSCLPQHHQYYPKGTALSVEINLFLTRPSSCSKKRKLPCVRGDVDNYIKLVLDALKGEVFDDDGQITTCLIRKRYSSLPHIDVNIKEDEDG